MQRDPLGGNIDSMSLYEYVASAPSAHADPLGLSGRGLRVVAYQREEKEDGKREMKEEAATRALRETGYTEAGSRADCQGARGRRWCHGATCGLDLQAGEHYLQH